MNKNLLRFLAFASLITLWITDPLSIRKPKQNQLIFMANDNQNKLIKQELKEEFKNRNFAVPNKANFSKQELNDVDFSNSNLTGVSFHSSSLIKSKFNNAILIQSTFAYADLTDANFQNADIRKANFVNSNLRNVNFKGAIYDRYTIGIDKELLIKQGAIEK